MSDFRDPFEAASWSLEPGHTVLVNVDLQNDFLHPDGWYGKSDIDISHMRRVIRVGWGQVNTLERALAELAAFPVALAEA